jgi:DHA1 family multidrug resistance protein-like MFS transporter
MSKNRTLFSFAYLIVFFLGVMFGLESIVPLFFTSLGVSIFDWGILAFVSTLGMLFFEMIWGMLSDKFGKSTFIAGGLMISASVILAYTLPFFLPLFLVLQALRGIFSVMLAPPTRMLVSELCSPTRLAFALGLWFSASRLGATVGSVFLSYVAQESSYSLAFISCSVLLFIVGFAAFVVLRRVKTSVQEPVTTDGRSVSNEGSARQALREILKVNSIYIVFFCAVMGFLQMSMIRTIVPIFASEILGASTFVVGLNQAEFTGLCVVFFPLSGLLVNRVGKKRTIAVGFAFLLLSAVAFSLTTDLFQLFVSTLLSSLGFSLVAPSLLALLVSSVPKNVLGGSIGIYGSVENLGITIAPLLFAFIWSLWGPQYAFIVCAIAQAVAVIFALTLERPKARALN